jgi:hypothetical protein
VVTESYKNLSDLRILRMDDRDPATKNMSLSKRLERSMIDAMAKDAPSLPRGSFDPPRYSRHLDFIRVAPPTLQIVMLSVIETADDQSKSVIKVGEAYDACLKARKRWSINSISPTAYRNYLAELDLYDLLRYPREQRSEGFTTRRIWLKLPKDVFAEIHGVILSALLLRIERHGPDARQDRDQRYDSTR